MSDYFSFAYSGISKASDDSFADGGKLAVDCLRDLGEKSGEDFRPKLLIILASPVYLLDKAAKQLLKGINEIFREREKETPLIGSTVAAVFFDGKIHDKGVLLICLASDLIDTTVACGEDARRNPESAINDVLCQLEVTSDKIDPNPLANKLIITFLPGCRRGNEVNFYPAPELHDLLYKSMNTRIMLAGGVSSANDRNRESDGIQFFGDRVLRDSIVAARITTGVPIGVGLNDALKSTGDVLTVLTVGDNGRNIEQFEDNRVLTPQETLSNIGRVGGDLLLAKMSSENERILDLPLTEGASGSVSLLRQIKPGDYFEVVKPTKDILETIQNGISQSRNRVFMENAIASILFPSKSYLRFHELGLMNFEKSIAKTEKELNAPCVGGFVDGEIGVDERGRSYLSNGSISYLTFGDEMRERTPLYKGVSALAEIGPQLFGGVRSQLDLIDKSIENALRIVDVAGFPGAMMSLVLSNFDRNNGRNIESVIAKQIGPRFLKIAGQMSSNAIDLDIRKTVIEKRQPIFVPDSRIYNTRGRVAVPVFAVVSQYVVPLKSFDGTVFGTLQVDLGDLKHLSDGDFRKTEKARVLDCFGEVFGAALNQIASATENLILQRIDRALEKAVSANQLSIGLKRFIEALKDVFNVEYGHLWLIDMDAIPKTMGKTALFLEAGFGKVYTAIKENGEKIEAHEDSPVTLAYKEKGPHIINELGTDAVWQATLARNKNNKSIDGLVTIRSYAAIRIEDRNGKVLGVISFGSSKPWFFLKFHQNAMKVVADRLRYLIENVQTKINHDFLLAVSPKLTERNLDDTQSILETVTETFHDTLKADVTSLYLWDHDRNMYVLRAESGWRNKEWIHAARHKVTTGWIGLKTEGNTPVYIPDLYEHYKRSGYEYPWGLYSEQMFGRPLSDRFTVESIALPLQIGPRKRDRFGILTLHRQKEKGRATGFVTKNVDLLQEGAYQLAGLINAVLQHRNEIGEKEEEVRRQRVYDAINFGDENKYFEMTVCREVLRVYQASEVSFFKTHKSDKLIVPYCVAGFEHKYGEITQENMVGVSSKYGQNTREALKSLSALISFNFRKLNEVEQSDPRQCRFDGLVDEVYVPLISDNEYLAGLVIKWNFDSNELLWPKTQHGEKNLFLLGRVIAAAYSKRQMKRRAEERLHGIQTAGLYVFQYAHKFVNAIANIYSLALLIGADKGDKKKQLQKLEEIYGNYSQEFRWIFELGDLVQKPNREHILLRDFVQDCWRALQPSVSNIMTFQNLVENNIVVIADRRLLREVFINLINNANEALHGVNRKNKCLTINARVSQDGEKARIVFSDNGKGMSKEQIKTAEQGYVNTAERYGKSKHKGVGVLISKYILRFQDGSLQYESVKGAGTDAIVELRYSPNIQENK